LFTALVILSALLVAEFVMAPINLWTGRTMPIFTKFTGHSPGTARKVFAPVKLVGAVLVALGLVAEPLSIAGAAILSAVCAYYLLRLAAPSRRDPSGIIAFVLFGASAVGLLAVQLGR
jgi:uncharacterized membrane protein YphA (DoxX/SURF4 family)